MAIKSSQYVTKQDLNEAVETIVNGMDNIANSLKSDIKMDINRVEIKVNELSEKVDRLNQDTVTQTEFNKLKTRVDQHLAIG